MSELQATLDAIDELAVQQCGHCSRPLPEDGQSPDFCNDFCQQAWITARNEVVELIGYREPYDMPEYFANQVELYSPEVSPIVQVPRIEVFGCSCGACSSGTTWTSATFTLTFDDTPIREAISRVWDQLDDSYQRTSGWTWRTGSLAEWTILDEGIWFDQRQPVAAPEPVEVGEPFDPEYEYDDWTPIPALHAGETALPEMAPHGHDWQALANAHRPQDRFSVSAERERRGSTNRRVR